MTPDLDQRPGLAFRGVALGSPRFRWYKALGDVGKSRACSMRPGHDEKRKRGMCGMLALAMGAAMLSGCSSITGSDDTPSLSSRFASFFSGAKPGVKQPASPTPSAPDIECPGVDIRAGASTLNINAKTAQA